MSLIEVKVEFDHSSGLPEDIVTNSWHFTTTASPPLPATLASILTEVEDVYTDVNAPGVQPLLFYYSGLLAGSYRLMAYNLDGPPPHPPAASISGSYGVVTGGGPLPEEVALCGSYQAVFLAGAIQARRRGRIYFGPFNLNALDTGDGRPEPALMNAVAGGLDALKAADAGAVDWQWVVYSPTSNASVQADNGWVDNAWDTVRSRGPDASVRQLWS